MKFTKKTSLAAVLLALTITGATFTACNEQVENSSDSFSEEIFSGSDFETSASDSSSSAESSPPSNSSSSSSSNNSSNSSSESTKEPTETIQPTTTYQQYIRCTSNNVNIRSGAGTDYAVLGSAEKGTVYAVVGKTGSWYKTYYRNKVAYISTSYASVLTLEKSDDSDVENVLSEGYKLIGVPYVYGAVRLHDGTGKMLSGFTAQKFDCSSLVQYVFYKGAGTILQVNTRTQVKQGKYVAPSDLQRGDCIFFTNEDRKYNTGIERVGHVAIYLGNNYILHTSSDYARIEKMSTTRWNYYIEARRFL